MPEIEAHRALAVRGAALPRHGGAARKAGRSTFNEVVEFSRSAMASRRGVLLIEGIGGVMVPLDDRRTVLDWMSVLAHPDRAGRRERMSAR